MNSLIKALGGSRLFKSDLDLHLVRGFGESGFGESGTDSTEAEIGS